MSLFPKNVIDLVTKSAYWADRSVRADFANGFIAGENDYTSNFTAELRRQVNAKAYPGLKATSFVLPKKYEQKIGADACIILSNSVKAKICIFEGKWPKQKTKVNAWDQIQKSCGRSHFSDQLLRQRVYAGRFSVWEMFYSEFPYGTQGAPFRKYVSTCIEHSDAVGYMLSRANPDAVWVDSDLDGMLKSIASKPPRVDQILEKVCQCRLGSVISADSVIDELGELMNPANILQISLDQYCQ